MSIDVSLIIVNWNTNTLLRRCLHSLSAGLGGVAAEIIVVDNGSTDGSTTMVREEFPHVRLMSNRTNVGFASANNQAFRHAAGRYVLLLNPDTEVSPGAVERLVQFLDAEPAARAGATAVLRNPDGTVQHYHKRLPRWRYVLFVETVLRNLFPRNPWARALYMLDGTQEAVMEIEQPPAACLMVRRSVLERTGLFDERFPIFYNDVDLCRRLKDAGHRLYLVPQAEVLHHGGAGGVMRLPDAGSTDSLIGLLRYYRKHEGPAAAVLLWLVLTINTILVLVGGAVKVAIGRRSPAWWRTEAGKRMRLALVRESFRHPVDEEAHASACVMACRR